MSADGKTSEIVDQWTGHTDLVRSTAYNGSVLVTGGEDGKLVVKNIDLRFVFLLFRFFDRFDYFTENFIFFSVKR